MFLGYNKNFNYKKHANKLCEEFLKPGEQTQAIFADENYIKRQIGEVKTPSDLLKISKFITSKLKRKCLSNNRKFERCAKEIWISGYCENACDFALVFESIARQLNIPTIHLQMVELSWKQSRQDGFIEIHNACECCVSGNWVYIDPSQNELKTSYNPQNTIISSKNLLADFKVFAKSTDLFETGVNSEDALNKKVTKLFGAKSEEIKNRG